MVDESLAAKLRPLRASALMRMDRQILGAAYRAVLALALEVGKVKAAARAKGRGWPGPASPEREAHVSCVALQSGQRRPLDSDAAVAKPSGRQIISACRGLESVR
jgi:chorismate mutase